MAFAGHAVFDCRREAAVRMAFGEKQGKKGVRLFPKWGGEEIAFR